MLMAHHQVHPTDDYDYDEMTEDPSLPVDVFGVEDDDEDEEDDEDGQKNDTTIIQLPTTIHHNEEDNNKDNPRLTIAEDIDSEIGGAENEDDDDEEEEGEEDDDDDDEDMDMESTSAAPSPSHTLNDNESNQSVTLHNFTQISSATFSTLPSCNNNPPQSSSTVVNITSAVDDSGNNKNNADNLQNVRSRKQSRRPRYTPEERRSRLEEAVRTVLQEKMSMRQAAMRFDLAKSSLCDYVKKRGIKLPAFRIKNSSFTTNNNQHHQSGSSLIHNNNNNINKLQHSNNNNNNCANADEYNNIMEDNHSLITPSHSTSTSLSLSSSAITTTTTATTTTPLSSSSVNHNSTSSTITTTTNRKRMNNNNNTIPTPGGKVTNSKSTTSTVNMMTTATEVGNNPFTVLAPRLIPVSTYIKSTPTSSSASIMSFNNNNNNVVTPTTTTTSSSSRSSKSTTGNNSSSARDGKLGKSSDLKSTRKKENGNGNNNNNNTRSISNSNNNSNNNNKQIFSIGNVNNNNKKNGLLHSTNIINHTHTYIQDATSSSSTLAMEDDVDDSEKLEKMLQQHFLGSITSSSSSTHLHLQSHPSQTVPPPPLPSPPPPPLPNMEDSIEFFSTSSVEVAVSGFISRLNNKGFSPLSVENWQVQPESAIYFCPDNRTLFLACIGGQYAGTSSWTVSIASLAAPMLKLQHTYEQECDDDIMVASPSHGCLSQWIDWTQNELGIAGKVVYKCDGNFICRSIQSSGPVLCLKEDKDCSKYFKVQFLEQKQNGYLKSHNGDSSWSPNGSHHNRTRMLHLLASILNVAASDIVSYDIYCCETSPASGLSTISSSFITARVGAYAAFHGFLHSLDSIDLSKDTSVHLLYIHDVPIESSKKSDPRCQRVAVELEKFMDRLSRCVQFSMPNLLMQLSPFASYHTRHSFLLQTRHCDMNCLELVRQSQNKSMLVMIPTAYNDVMDFTLMKELATIANVKYHAIDNLSIHRKNSLLATGLYSGANWGMEEAFHSHLKFSMANIGCPIYQSSAPIQAVTLQSLRDLINFHSTFHQQYCGFHSRCVLK